MAVINVCSKLVTLLVSQAPMSWLKTVAPEKAKPKSVTLDVSQLLIVLVLALLNALAEAKIPSKVVALEMSHPPIS